MTWLRVDGMRLAALFCEGCKGFEGLVRVDVAQG